MKHSLSGSSSRRLRYHGDNKNHTPNVSNRPLQDRKSLNKCPPIPNITNTPKQDHCSLSATASDDYDTFSPPFIPSSPAPSILTRILNRFPALSKLLKWLGYEKVTDADLKGIDK